MVEYPSIIILLIGKLKEPQPTLNLGYSLMMVRAMRIYTDS